MTCVKPDYQDIVPASQEIKLEDIIQMCDTLTKDLPKEPDDCCKISKYSSDRIKIEIKYECHGGRRIKIISDRNLVLECFIEDESNPAHASKLEYRKGPWEQELKGLYERLPMKEHQDQLTGACYTK